MKKVSIIVNKNWEVEPFLNALLSTDFWQRKDLLKGAVINSPKDADNRMDIPRSIFVYQEMEVTVWCIQDLMSPPPVSSSSSEDKYYHALPKIFAATQPDFVMAVGTAGFVGETSYNGAVVVGSEFFIHDAKPATTSSHFPRQGDTVVLDELLPSNVPAELFHPAKGIFTAEFHALAEAKMLQVPNHAAERPLCIAAANYAALSFVNITGYGDYAWADHKGIEAYQQKKMLSPIGSVETTHGLIKLSTKQPILFLSGITDRIGHFNMEVTPLQNYVAAFNCGMVAGQLLPMLNRYI
jgi:hypothetical protein